MNRFRKLKSFWFIYGLITGIAVVCISVLFIFFYDMMAAYEASQPQSTVESYMDSLNTEKINELAKAAVSELDLVYESEDTYIKALTEAYTKDNAVCSKLLAKSTADRPVFSVKCNNTEVVRLTLERSDSKKYGFDNWIVSEAVIPTDGITEKAENYTVYVPTGCTLSVNGISPVAASVNIPSPIVSSLEDASLPNCDMYELGTLYSTPELLCTSSEGPLASLTDRGATVFLPVGVSLQNYEVSAPTGATVYVNGIALDESFVVSADVPYEYSAIEKSLDGLPTYSVYKTGNLFFSPVITCDMNEEALTAQVDGTSCSFPYPESLMYSLTVKAPAGSSITVDGIPISDAAEAAAESAFEGLKSIEAVAPMYDVYRIDGLFSAEHSVSGSLDGVDLSFRDTGTERDIILTSYNSSAVDDSVTEYSLAFIQAYFKYTSQGYVNINEHLAAVLEYIEPGSELYTRIHDSKIGYEFQSPATKEDYRQLEVSQLYRLDDGSYVAKVLFDVDQTIISVHRSYKGEVTFHIVNDGTSMKVRDMVIASE